MNTVITAVKTNTNVMCINHSYTYYCVFNCHWFTKLCFSHDMLKSMHHGFSVCGMWQNHNPHEQWGFAVLLPSDSLQNVLTVNLEVLWSWRHYIHWKHWLSPTGLNGVKSRKTTLCGKTCVHVNVFPAPVLSKSHFNVHSVVKNIIMLLQCCVGNEHMQTCWVFLLFTLHKILH
jgi:hypothetical protein